MGKLPASLFYWGDFVRDPNVRRCTHSEVGVWIRLLCLMFDAETKGVLETSGVPWTDEEIIMAIGGKYEETEKAVTALVTKGVASRSDRGSLMNRRMYREEKERVDTRERVRKHRAKQEGQGDSNGECNAEDTRCTESECETATELPAFVTKPKTVKLELEGIYSAYPRKIGRSGAMKAISRAVDRLTAGEGSYKLEPAAAVDFLRSAAEAFAQSPSGRAGEYTPHPATWFNNSRYLDDPKEWQRGGTHAKPEYAKSKSDRTLDALRASLAADDQGRTGAAGDFAQGRVIEGGTGPLRGGAGELGDGRPPGRPEIVVAAT